MCILAVRETHWKATSTLARWWTPQGPEMPLRAFEGEQVSFSVLLKRSVALAAQTPSGNANAGWQNSVADHLANTDFCSLVER